MRLTIYGLAEQPVQIHNTGKAPEVGETLVHELPDGTCDAYRVVRRDWHLRHHGSFSALRPSELLLDVAIWIEAVTP